MFCQLRDLFSFLISRKFFFDVRSPPFATYITHSYNCTMSTDGPGSAGRLEQLIDMTAHFPNIQHPCAFLPEAGESGNLTYSASAETLSTSLLYYRREPVTLHRPAFHEQLLGWRAVQSDSGIGAKCATLPSRHGRHGFLVLPGPIEVVACEVN